jgi:hypothetical protein
MPKLQYNSDDEVVKSNSDNEINEIIQEVKQQRKEKKVYKEVVKEPPKEIVVKEKKPFESVNAIFFLSKLTDVAGNGLYVASSKTMPLINKFCA